MNATPTKVMVVHSFAIHGNASLKVFIRRMGGLVLPVPSLTLTGLTNIPGAEKVEVDFSRLLWGSLELARKRGERLILFVGYLGAVDQAAEVTRAIDAFQDIIEAVVVDPVSGDHGKAYVAEEIIKAWPAILMKADWAVPNFTEIQLLLGLSPNIQLPVEPLLAQFAERFPALQFIVSSIPTAPGELETRLFTQSQFYPYRHSRLSRDYGGSGDLFASEFLKRHFFAKERPVLAMEQAAQLVKYHIAESIRRQSPDLWIGEDVVGP